MEPTVVLQKNDYSQFHWKKRLKSDFYSTNIPSADQGSNDSSEVIQNDGQKQTVRRIIWEAWETNYFIRLVFKALGQQSITRTSSFLFYTSLIKPLADVGIHRDAIQLRTKWQKLKYYYKKKIAEIKKNRYAAYTIKPHFKLLHAVFRSKPMYLYKYGSKKEKFKSPQELNPGVDLQNIKHPIFDGRFFKVLSIDFKSRVQAECQACMPPSIHYATSKTKTSNLKKHLKKFHPDAFELFEQRRMQIKAKKYKKWIYSKYAITPNTGVVIDTTSTTSTIPATTATYTTEIQENPLRIKIIKNGTKRTNHDSDINYTKVKVRKETVDFTHNNIMKPEINNVETLKVQNLTMTPSSSHALLLDRVKNINKQRADSPCQRKISENVTKKTDLNPNTEPDVEKKIPDFTNNSTEDTQVDNIASSVVQHQTPGCNLSLYLPGWNLSKYQHQKTKLEQLIKYRRECRREKVEYSIADEAEKMMNTVALLYIRKQYFLWSQKQK